MTTHKPNCPLYWMKDKIMKNGEEEYNNADCTCKSSEEGERCCGKCITGTKDYGFECDDRDCDCHKEPQKCNERIINSAGECIDGLCKSDHTPESQEDWEKQWIEFVKYNGVSIFESAEKNHFLKIKAFIHQTLATERKKMLESLLEKLPINLWDDEDAAVGGYISKKDLKNTINTLLGE